MRGQEISPRMQGSSQSPNESLEPKKQHHLIKIQQANCIDHLEIILNLSIKKIIKVVIVVPFLNVGI